MRIDKDNKTIKQLKNENKRLEDRITVLENEIEQLKTIHDAVLQDYKSGIKEAKEIKKKYNELINKIYKMQDKYTNEIGVLLRDIGGTDLSG